MKKWGENLTWTPALSVTLFPILCFVPIFAFFPFPVPRFSFLVLATSLREKLEGTKLRVLWVDR